MGLFDFLKKKSGETKEDTSTEKTERAEEYDGEVHTCALCGQEIKPGEGKYYGGQWWHKKCLRKARKMAKSFI